jgi:LysM repeat protein
MMNKIDNSGQGLARLGRDEDQYMAHVAQGEMVVPPIISTETRERIEAEMRAAGLSPDEYTVGGGMSINPITGLPEFGWLKKKFKQVKKVVKKLAPVAAVIPGPWQGPAIMYNRGKAVVDLARGKGDLGTVIGAFAGGKAGTAGKGNIFGNIKEFVTKGSDGVGLLGNLGKGIGGLKDRVGEFLFKGTDNTNLFGNIAKGFGKGYEYVMPGKDGVGVFGNVFGTGQGTEYEIQPGDNLTEIARKSGTTVEALMEANGITNPDMIQAGAKLKIPGSGFLSNILGENQGSVADYNPTTGQGQSKIGLIEDFLKGIGGKTQEGIASLIGGGDSKGIFDGNMGAAALAGLLGKITYDSAKERMGGLAETPAVTMDALGRYQLSKELGTGGTRGEFGLPEAQKALEFNMGGPVYRQYFNVGGVAELDMREGGESAGPGTGTSDDIPAMLSDGEYVMTAKATRGAGAFDVNKTKSGIELIKGGSPSRKKGVENMRQLMDIFEAI